MIIDHRVKNQRLHSLRFEHLQIGRLHPFIVRIIDLVFMLFPGSLKVIRQGGIFLLSGRTVDHLILDLFVKLILTHHTVLDKGMDIFPDRLEEFPILFRQLNDFGGNPTADHLTDLAHLRLILQVTARYVQRQVRSIEAALQWGEEFRDQLRCIVRHKHLVAEQFDVTLGHIKLIV